jgi:hypothetical protein
MILEKGNIFLLAMLPYIMGKIPSSKATGIGEHIYNFKFSIFNSKYAASIKKEPLANFTTQ